MAMILTVVTRVTCCPPVPVRVYLKTQVSKISPDDDDDEDDDGDDDGDVDDDNGDVDIL